MFDVRSRLTSGIINKLIHVQCNNPGANLSPLLCVLSIHTIFFKSNTLQRLVFCVVEGGAVYRICGGYCANNVETFFLIRSTSVISGIRNSLSLPFHFEQPSLESCDTSCFSIMERNNY